MDKLKNLSTNKKALNWIKSFSGTKDIVMTSIYMQLFLIFAFVLFKRSSIIACFLFFVPSCFTFTLWKTFMKEEEAKKFFKYVKLNFLLFLITLVNHGSYKFVYLPILRMKLSTNTMAIQANVDTGLALIFAFVVSIITFFLCVFYNNEDDVKLFFESYLEQDYFDTLGFDFEAGDMGNGDVILCKSITKKKKIILKGKDRFLHSLILGPTGSGKTSQTIIPMINQDMQNMSCGLTIIEPKGDLAEKVAAMGQHYGRPVVYFNPILDACPSFNPLYGKEEDVVENITTTFKMLNPDSSQYFQDMNEQLLRNALSLLKRLKGNNATLIDLHRLISNTGGEGRKMVNSFAKLPAANVATTKENEDIANYFLGDYLVEKSKTYENCSGVRSQVSKLISNKFLRRVLNPENGQSDVDFSDHLAKGGVIAITTAQGKLRDLGKYLGYFIILNFQSAVFKRPGNEDTRKYHFLYIDEFQVYTNPGFADMLTQGRSYRVASHLATQNRALIGMGGGSDGDDFVELVSTNARNIIVYPGGNYNDAKYYSDQFGKVMQRTVQKGITRKKWSPIYGVQPMDMPSESARVTEEYVERFRPDEIIQRPFGEITFAIIKDNTLQLPDVGEISYIPKELNSRLNRMVQENNILMMKGMDPNEYRDLSNHGELLPIVHEKLDMDKYIKILESEFFNDEALDEEEMSEQQFSEKLDKIKEAVGEDSSEQDFDSADVVIDEGIQFSLDTPKSSSDESPGSSGTDSLFEDIDIDNLF